MQIVFFLEVDPHTTGINMTFYFLLNMVVCNIHSFNEAFLINYDIRTAESPQHFFFFLAPSVVIVC